jgi:alpha-ketoglutarate-dependent taurine dioxygenase
MQADGRQDRWDEAPSAVPSHHYVRWLPFDPMMWDNRTTMHRAYRCDRNAVRDMRRITVAGAMPTAAQAAA